MEQKITFLDVIKEKPLHLLGGTAVATLVVHKIFEFAFNWWANWKLMEEGLIGEGQRQNYTIHFSPVLLLLSFFIVITVMKWYMNRKRKNTKMSKLWNKIVHGEYTWKDIFKDIKSFLRFVFEVIVVYCTLDLFAHVLIEWLGILGYIIAIFITIGIKLVLENTLYAWIRNNPNGQRTYSYFVFCLGIVTALVMSGIDVIFTTYDEEAIVQDLILEQIVGIYVPFDILTGFLTLVTYLFAKAAPIFAPQWEKCKRKGVNIAVVSFILSFTPVASVLSWFWIGVAGANAM